MARRPGALLDLITALAYAQNLPLMNDAIEVALELPGLSVVQPALRVHAQAAFLLLGGSHSRDEAVAARLCRPVETDMTSLARELVKRHGDGADPPSSLGLAQALPGSASWKWFHPRLS